MKKKIVRSKKPFLLVFLVLLLAWTELCLAGQAYFQTTGLWRVASNWATWDGAQLPPSATDWANLNNGNVRCTIDASTTAVCSKLTLPDWQNFMPDACYLDMTGGILQIGGNFEIGNWRDDSRDQLDRGEFSISGGTVTAGGDLYVGRDGIAAVNMTGGAITVSGTLYIPLNAGGTGRLNLDTGTINANSLSMNSGGRIDIHGGILSLNGDKRSTINPYVTDGWVTANGGTSLVSVDYNSTTDKTIVTSQNPGINLTIDDFESYTSSANLRASWHDSSNGGVNSTVALETNIIHGGSKSMSCSYDNSGTTHYSETYYSYGSAQNWTDGLKILGLYFHGSQANAAEKMYVLLEDVNGAKAKVTYGDANDIIQQKEEFWRVWNIMLLDFENGGVDLSRAKKIAIGFGDSNNPPGGVGTVYFDDVKLSASPFTADYSYTPPSDFNSDAAVNACDYAALSDAWQAKSNEPKFSELYDLDENGVVNFRDLVIFVSYWLWPMEQVLITVDANAVKGAISSDLTGINTSWYYDNDAIWADGSMAGYLKDFGVRILRYPGGVETSKFHWETPYGHWNVDLWEPGVNYPPTSAYMNTDDYIAQCRAVGAEPLIGINIQSGKKYNRIQDSIDEAVGWVRYCKDHNYNVKYWYLDNEPYYNSNSGPISVSEYAGYITQFVPAMRAVDPNIKIIVNWENKLSVAGYWDAWKTLFQTAGAYFDIADVHWYWAWDYATWDMWLSENPMKVREWCGDCPNSKYIGPSYADEIKGFYDKIKDINGVSYNCKLAALEWNIAPTHDNRFSRFQHALMQSEMIGQFIEGGLEIACIWPLTWDGTLGGDFRTVLDDANHKPTPSSWVFKLYSHALGQKLVTSGTSVSHIRPVSVLSNDGNTVRVYLLHKSGEEDAARAQVSISGFAPAKAEAITFTAATLSSNVAGLKKIAIGANGNGQWECVLPPHSLTMLTFHKNN